jgi:excisionase family DNA binding protein
MRTRGDTVSAAEPVVLLPSPGGGWLALTPQQFQDAAARASRLMGDGYFGPPPALAPKEGRSRAAGDISEEPLLTAAQMAERTGVPASWFEVAARKDEIKHYRVGERWVRFKYSELFDQLRLKGKCRRIGHTHSSGVAYISRGRKKVPVTDRLPDTTYASSTSRVSISTPTTNEEE